MGGNRQPTEQTNPPDGKEQKGERKDVSDQQTAHKLGNDVADSLASKNGLEHNESLKHNKSQQKFGDYQLPDLKVGGTYDVKAGNTMWGLAEQVLEKETGHKANAKEIWQEIKDLQKANPEIKNASRINVGEHIKLPGHGTTDQAGKQSANTNDSASKPDQIGDGRVSHTDSVGQQTQLDNSAERQKLNQTFADNGIVPDSGKQKAEQAKKLSELRNELPWSYENYVRATPQACSEAIAGLGPNANPKTVGELTALQNISNQQTALLQQRDELRDQDNQQKLTIAQQLTRNGSESLDVHDPQFMAKAESTINQMGGEQSVQLQKQLNDLKQTESTLQDVQTREHQLEQDRSALLKEDPSLDKLLRQDITYTMAATKNIEIIQDIRTIEYDTKRGDDFKADMDAIDHDPKIDQAQRNRIYGALSEIAEDKGGPPNHMNQDQKTILIEQLAHQIAHPNDIKQGSRGSCPLASSEFALSSTNPALYAKYVADLATTGQTMTAGKNGVELTLGPNALNTPDGKPIDDYDPVRTIPSRLFQDATAGRIGEYKYGKGTTYLDAPGGLFMYDDQTGKDEKGAKNGGVFVEADGVTTHPWTGANAHEDARLQSELTGNQYHVDNIDLQNPAKSDIQTPDQFAKAIEQSGYPVTLGFQQIPGEFDFTGMNENGGHDISITNVSAPRTNPETGKSDQWITFDNTADDYGTLPNGVWLSHLLDSLKASGSPATLTVRQQNQSQENN